MLLVAQRQWRSLPQQTPPELSATAIAAGIDRLREALAKHIIVDEHQKYLGDIPLDTNNTVLEIFAEENMPERIGALLKERLTFSRVDLPGVALGSFDPIDQRLDRVVKVAVTQ